MEFNLNRQEEEFTYIYYNENYIIYNICIKVYKNKSKLLYNKYITKKILNLIRTVTNILHK